MDFKKFGQKRKEKKKKQVTEKFVSLTANGAEVTAINFSLKKDEDGEPRLYVLTPDVAEALHYEHVDFELKTTNKMIRVAGKFKDARNEKKFKLYIFDIEDYNQFFI